MDSQSCRTSVSKLSSEGWRLALMVLSTQLLACGLVGCGDDALTPASLVVRNRVAAIRATPAEIGVGESTLLEALLVHPEPQAPDLGQIWFTCLQTQSATGCLNVDFDIDLGSPGDDDDSAEQPSIPSNIQFGLGSSFAYTAEGPDVEAAWEELTAEERVEGLTVLVSVAFVALSSDELLALFAGLMGGDEGAGGFGDALGELMEDAILATRRIVISDKAGASPAAVACDVSELLPNTVPGLERLRFHLDPKGRDSGVEIADEESVTPGQAMTLRPQLSDGSIEPYLYITRDGETECRTEAPYFAWLSNGGSHAGAYSFTADAEDLDETPGRPKVHSFTLPDEDEFSVPIDLWVVVRDRRGGVDWRQWRFSPELAVR